MIAVKFITQIRSAEGEDVRVFFFGIDVRAADVEQTVTGGRRFECENVVRIFFGSEQSFWSDAQAFVTEIESDAQASRLNRKSTRPTPMAQIR